MRTFALLLMVAWASTGCGSLRPPPKPGSPAGTSIRNNAYSLLFQLLDQEKDVSKILIIKRETTELHQLIKNISTVSGAGAGKLEQFAKADASLSLKNVDLPTGEVRTRAAISSATTKELLATSGGKFELNLLLTQAEALNYGWHLAGVASENDPTAERAHYLKELSGELKGLHERVVAMIAQRRDAVPAGPKSGTPRK